MFKKQIDSFSSDYYLHKLGQKLSDCFDFQPQDLTFRVYETNKIHSSLHILFGYRTQQQLASDSTKTKFIKLFTDCMAKKFKESVKTHYEGQPQQIKVRVLS